MTLYDKKTHSALPYTAVRSFLKSKKHRTLFASFGKHPQCDDD